jgi:Spy/CpxP family protein refolding chaperone
MKKFLNLVVISAVSVAALAGCAANMPSARDNNGFDLLSSDDASQNQWGAMGKNLGAFVKDLNLTDAQKTQFKALKDSMKTNIGNNKDNREALKNVLKDAFLSSSIDKAALKSKLLALQPQSDDRISQMSGNIIKAYNILTPEQRTKVENKLNEMEKKMQGFMKNPMAKNFQGSDKMIERFTKDLNLTDTQKSSLKALVEEGKPDHTAMFEKAGQVKSAVLAELKTGNPSADKIKGILQGIRGDMQSNIDSRLDKLVKVHDLLTPDQRQKLVDNLEKMGKNFQGKMKSHSKWRKK